MSRITGILTKNDIRAKDDALARMLAASASDAAWKSSNAASGRASLGWTGWGASNVASTNEIISVVDGRIYNKEDLGFKGQSDAEAISKLHLKFGFRGALENLIGDFSLAVFDTRTETLWLARDRIGVKPLYYCSSTDFFAFASRPAALLTLPGISRDVNNEFVAIFAACHYRYFDNDPDQSPYKDIHQLPAGQYLKITPESSVKARYWSLLDLPDFEEPEEELAQRYRELLSDAVAIRLKGAAGPAFTLSGGMDSSSVLASAVRFQNEKQHAFSTVYDDQTYDESHEIRSMLDSAVQEWHQVRVGTPDVFDLVGKMVRIHDEPVATSTWLSHFLLCDKVADDNFGSLFGGLGGDELNAGEYEYFFYHFADLRAAGKEDFLKTEVEFWIRYHDHPVFKKSRELVEGSIKRLVNLNEPGRCLPDGNRLTRYYSALNDDFYDMTCFEPVMEHPFRSFLKNRAFQDIFRETAPCCLRAEDRQTTAFGLDHFLPFFDHRLVEFMFRVPGNMKIRSGVTKHILRLAMQGILPEETRTRVKKTGWNAPAHVWFSGGCKDNLLDLIHSQSFRERGIYNVDEVLRLAQEHEEIVSSGGLRENHMMFLWQLVNLEIWMASNSCQA